MVASALRNDIESAAVCGRGPARHPPFLLHLCSSSALPMSPCRPLLAAVVLTCWLGVATVTGHRDPPLDDPRNNTLVEVGSEQVAIFSRSESPDGRYALAWTLRPRANQPPPDWSSYNPAHAYDWLNQYRTPYRDTPGDYLVVNGLVDLHAHTFTPLDTIAPVAPNNLYAELQVVWFEDGQDFRSALVNACAQGSALWRSTGLWLIEVGTQAPSVVDLTAEAEQVVKGYLEKTVSTRAKDYWADYAPGDIKKPGKPRGIAPKTWTIKLPFDADLPAGDGKVYSGTVAIAMPAGKIAGLTVK